MDFVAVDVVVAVTVVAVAVCVVVETKQDGGSLYFFSGKRRVAGGLVGT